MNKRGFTLLEVTLFLAISSSLALVAFVGLGPKLRNVRFTDSMRGVEASVQKTVTDSRSGLSKNSELLCKKMERQVTLNGQNVTNYFSIIDGGAQAGSSQDCVLNGVFIDFNKNQNKVLYQTIASLRERRTGASCNSANDAARMYECFGAFPVDNTSSNSEYSLTNGLVQTSSGTRHAYYYLDPETNQPYTTLVSDGNYVDEMQVCYKLDSRVASLNFTTKSIDPEVSFDKQGCE
jgi:type II secretory pathway pseudopilin PulG